VPKPIKLLECTGNGGNGALIRSTAILWKNDQHPEFRMQQYKQQNSRY